MVVSPIDGGGAAIEREYSTFRRALADKRRFEALEAGRRTIDACRSIIGRLSTKPSVFERLTMWHRGVASPPDSTHAIAHYTTIMAAVNDAMRPLEPQPYEHQRIVSPMPRSLSREHEMAAIVEELDSVATLMFDVERAAAAADPLVTRLSERIDLVDRRVAGAHTAIRRYHDGRVPAALAASAPPRYCSLALSHREELYCLSLIVLFLLAFSLYSLDVS